MKTTLGLYVLEGVEVVGGTSVSPLHPSGRTTGRGGRPGMGYWGQRGPTGLLRVHFPVPLEYHVKSGAVGGGYHCLA